MNFGVGDTHGILLRPETEVQTSSDSLGWERIYASVQREQPYKASYSAVPDHLIVMVMTGPVAVNRTIAGKLSHRILPPGALCILPGQIGFDANIESEIESLHVYLRQSLVAEVADDLFKENNDDIEIVPRLGEHDPLIEQLCLDVQRMLEHADPCDSMYVDYLSLSLAARLLRHHSTYVNSSAQTPSAAGALTNAQMARVIEFIDVNLDKSISLRKIAASTDLAVAHFARRFKVTTGLPPHQFLIRRRFERAKWLLSQSNHCLAEIALDAGFSHQEHMTRIFRRLGGTTPAAYRRTMRS